MDLRRAIDDWKVASERLRRAILAVQTPRYLPPMIKARGYYRLDGADLMIIHDVRDAWEEAESLSNFLSMRGQASRLAVHSRTIENAIYGRTYGATRTPPKTA